MEHVWKLYEMFCGYGGARWAFIRARIPFVSVGYSEIKKSAIKIYDQNFKNSKNFGDCTKIDYSKIENFDFLCAGFPCQDVSLLGLRDLSKGRTTLFSEILRAAQEKKPELMLLENVWGILSKYDFFKYTVRALKEAGYDVIIWKLNSKNWGSPQSRPRVYYLCKKGSWKKKPELENLERGKTFLKDVLEKEVNENFYLKKAQESSLITRRSRKNFAMKVKINPDFCECLVTSKPEGTLIEDLRGIRFLTTREVFRCQGFFQDEINIEGLSQGDLYDLAGDGWDVNLVSKILKEMVICNEN